jgi:hypothetical protein
MAIFPTVPAMWTECEIYMGFTIAVHNQIYCGFSKLGGRTSTYETRAEVRREIEDIVNKLHNVFN